MPGPPSATTRSFKRASRRCRRSRWPLTSATSWRIGARASWAFRQLQHPQVRPRRFPTTASSQTSTRSPRSRRRTRRSSPGGPRRSDRAPPPLARARRGLLVADRGQGGRQPRLPSCRSSSPIRCPESRIDIVPVDDARSALRAWRSARRDQGVPRRDLSRRSRRSAGRLILRDGRRSRGSANLEVDLRWEGALVDGTRFRAVIDGQDSILGEPLGDTVVKKTGLRDSWSVRVGRLQAAGQLGRSDHPQRGGSGTTERPRPSR